MIVMLEELSYQLIMLINQIETQILLVIY